MTIQAVDLISYLQAERNELIVKLFHSEQKGAHLDKQLRASVITATNLEAERDDYQRRLEALVLDPVEAFDVPRVEEPVE